MVSHTDLNRARLPIPPRPHIHFLFAFFAERKIYYTTLISKKQALFSFFYKYFDVFFVSARQAAGGKVPCRFRTGERQPVRCVFSFQVAFFLQAFTDFP